MKTERNRRDLREMADRYLEHIAKHSHEGKWEKAMFNARWLRIQRQTTGSPFDCLRHRRMINSARELRQFCRVMP